MERRTKQRNDALNQLAVGSSPLPHLSMGNRAVTIGRKVNFGFLEKKHFRIGSWIRNQGWEKIYSLDVPTYPKLVREFDESLRVGTCSIDSRVKGT